MDHSVWPLLGILWFKSFIVFDTYECKNRKVVEFVCLASEEVFWESSTFMMNFVTCAKNSVNLKSSRKCQSNPETKGIERLFCQKTWCHIINFLHTQITWGSNFKYYPSVVIVWTEFHVVLITTTSGQHCHNVILAFS